jgi:hypothetical protein
MDEDRTDEDRARDHRNEKPLPEMDQPFEGSGAKDPAASRMDRPLQARSGVRTDTSKPEEADHGREETRNR